MTSSTDTTNSANASPRPFDRFVTCLLQASRRSALWVPDSLEQSRNRRMLTDTRAA